MSTYEAHPGRPPKRPRLHRQFSTLPHRPSNIHGDVHGVSVKRELSPTPPPSQPTLIVCGTKRFAPYPTNCLPTNPSYKQNRRLWAKTCQSEIDSLKLVTEKLLIRDDGIIIDWKSQVPVWSDSLRPAEFDLAAAITKVHHANAQHRPGSLPSTPPPCQSPPAALGNAPSPPVKKLPIPPRPRRIVTHPSVSSSPRVETATKAPPVPSAAEVSVPSTAPSELLTVETASKEEENMSRMTMSYLERYFQTFDSDRASLASAYSGNASFSYREVKCFSPELQSSPPSSDAIKRDRLDITASLLSLPPLQLLPANSEAHVDYDMIWLGAPVGMFVVCRGVHHADASKLAVTHSFLLRCKETYQEDARADGVWPLVAVAHQVIVFDSKQT